MQFIEHHLLSEGEKESNKILVYGYSHQIESIMKPNIIPNTIIELIVRYSFDLIEYDTGIFTMYTDFPH